MVHEPDHDPAPARSSAVPSPPEHDAGSRPSVLSHISQLIGNEPKVLLREHDSDENVLSLRSDEVKARPFLSQRFQILGEIARGGVGVILKGHDLDLGRNVAVKVLRQDHLDNPAMIERFVEEAQIGGQLQHPGIVPVYELGQQEDRRPFFAMKLVKGRTLGKLLADRKDRRAERSQFLAIFHQVCQTVAYAHSRGVIHRDLKPANVMVGAFGEVQVVDWGLAKVLKEGGVADERRERRVEQTQMSLIETIRNRPGSSGSDSIAGSVMGTPGYMPPEQALGQIEKLDERTDVFALGAILCELLTGQGPYTGEPEDVYMQAVHARLDPAFARLDAVQVDASLIQLCKDCLAPAPPARPRDAGEVARRMGEYLSSTEQRAHDAEIAAAESRVRAVNERKARRLTLALAASLLVAAALGTGSYLFIENQRKQRIASAESAVSAACEGIHQLLGEAQAAEVGDYALLDAAAVKAGYARELADDPVVSDATRERVQQLAADVADRRQGAEARAADAARSAAMLVRLEEARVQSHDFGWDSTVAGSVNGGRFAQAFLDYGLDVATADLDEACAWIAEQPIAIELAFALDDWARVQRSQPAPDERPWNELVILAQAADPDELRNRVRDAILDDDVELLIELAETQDLAEVPAPTLVFLGETLYDARHSTQALALLLEAYAHHPEDPSLNMSIGRHLEGNNGRAAAQHYAAALALRPQDPQSRANLAWMFMKGQEFEEARRLIDAGLQRDPEDPLLLMTRAEIEFNAGDLDRTEELTREMIRLGQGGADYHLLRGKLLYRLQDYPAAIEEFQGAIEAAGKTPWQGNDDAERSLAFALYHDGQTDRARRLLSRARDTWSLYALSILTHEEGDLEESRSIMTPLRNNWKRLCESDPQVEDNPRSYAWILTSHPDPDSWSPELALEQATRAVELSPHHPHAWLVMAIAQYRNQNWGDVLEACARAEEPGASPPWDTLDYLAAGAYWHLGRRDEARARYERGLLRARRVENSIFWCTQEPLRRECAQLLGLE